MTAVALAYFTASRLGLFLPIDDRTVAVLWPAAGVALAALLLWGPEQWIGAAVGAALVPLAWGRPLPVAVLIGVANGVTALLAATACRRLGQLDVRLGRVRDVLVLAAIGGFATPMVNASIGLLAIWPGASATSTSVLRAWSVWWAGDALGVLLVTPLVLSWAGGTRLHRRDARTILEFAVGLPLLGLATWAAVAMGAVRPALFFVPVTLYAVRHGLRGGTASAAVVALATAIAASSGRGAFAGLTPGALVLALDANLVAVAAVGLATGAAVDALRSASEEQRAILDACPVAIIALDLEGRCIMWGGAAEAMFGYRAAEVVGRPLPYLPPERREEFAGLLKEVAAAGGRLRGFETVRLHRNGARVPVTLSAAPLRDGVGRLTGTLGVLEDTSERTSAQEDRARLAAILEATTDFVAIADLTGRTLYVNPGGRRLLGLPPDADLAGRPIAGYQAAWAAKRMLEEGVPAALRDGAWRGETALVGPGGEELPGLEVLVAPRDERGAPRFLAAIIRDISNEKAAEAAIQAWSERLVRVFNNVPVMLGFFRLGDNPGEPVTFEWVNRDWEKTLGWTLPEMQQLDMLVECYPDPAYRAEVAAFVMAAEGKWHEFKTRRRDGVVLTTEWANVRLSDGTIVALGQNVTERRALEERFRQAQKMEAVGLLAGGIAHDFNNILTGILGYSDELLMELPPESPLRADVAEISKAATRGATLTRQLLSFSRKQVLDPHNFDLNALVADLAAMLQRILGAPVRLNTALAPGACPVRADPAQVDQVIMNLAVNARDAMPAGGALTIGTAPVVVGPDEAIADLDLAPGRYASLTFTDTGIGMTDEVRGRIFEPFFTTKAGSGTGLGLATVYGIVRQSGGAIQVASKPGAGTTFSVYLPATDVVEAPVPSRASAPAPATNAGGGGETVLLIEDEAPLRRIITRMLGAAGYRVLETADAAAAIAQSRSYEGRIGLVITDVLMPGQTGPEAAAALRAERGDIEVLYISGYAADAPVARETGEPVDLLAKPFTREELLQKVRAMLDGRTSEGAA
jgi:two-component system cell cycle sensor histidine kinase/response regulator CckA